MPATAPQREGSASKLTSQMLSVGHAVPRIPWVPSNGSTWEFPMILRQVKFQYSSQDAAYTQVGIFLGHVQFFVNGTRVGVDQNIGQVTRFNANKMYIGRKGNSYCQCILDAVEIYERALSEAEADTIYQRVWGQ